MQIQIDKSKKTPLYRQITEQIQAQIISGEIPDGFQFPSERQLADTLGVNRTTVLNAYKELKADDLLASHVGRGTTAIRGTDQKIRKTDSRDQRSKGRLIVGISRYGQSAQAAAVKGMVHGNDLSCHVDFLFLAAVKAVPHCFMKLIIMISLCDL